MRRRCGKRIGRDPTEQSPSGLRSLWPMLQIKQKCKQSVTERCCLWGRGTVPRRLGGMGGSGTGGRGEARAPSTVPQSCVLSRCLPGPGKTSSTGQGGAGAWCLPVAAAGQGVTAFEVANKILPGRLASMAWAPRCVPCSIIGGWTERTAGDHSDFHTNDPQTGDTAESHQLERHLKNA